MLPQTHLALRAFWPQTVTRIPGMQFIHEDFQSHTCLWDYSVQSHIKTPKIWPSELFLLITPCTSGSLIPLSKADEPDKVSLRTGSLTETDQERQKHTANVLLVFQGCRAIQKQNTVMWETTKNNKVHTEKQQNYSGSPQFLMHLLILLHCNTSSPSCCSRHGQTQFAKTQIVLPYLFLSSVALNTALHQHKRHLKHKHMQTRDLCSLYLAQHKKFITHFTAASPEVKHCPRVSH